MSYTLSDNLKALYEAVFNKLRYFTEHKPTDEDVSDSLVPFMEAAIADSSNIVKAGDIDNGTFLYRATSGGNPVFVAKKLALTYKIKASCDVDGNPEVSTELLNNLTPAKTLLSFTREDTGIYVMTFSGSIASNTNYIDFHEREIIVGDTVLGKVRWDDQDSTSTIIKFRATDPDGTLSDYLLNNTVIQIDVYV